MKNYLYYNPTVDRLWQITEIESESEPLYKYLTVLDTSYKDEWIFKSIIKPELIGMIKIGEV